MFEGIFTFQELKFMKKTSRYTVLMLLYCFATTSSYSQTKTIWEIGVADDQSTGMAMAPSDYKQFLANDFGSTDRFFMVGISKAEVDWPYILPGAKDVWAGTRSHAIHALFSMENFSSEGNWKFIIDVAGYNLESPPILKVVINGKSWIYRFPKIESSDKQDVPVTNREHIIKIPIQQGLISANNEIQLISLDGSYLVFDQVRLEGPAQACLKIPENAFIREVKPAGYETEHLAGKFQPLLIDLEHLSGKPLLKVLLDGQSILEERIEKGRYQFEAPMPAVTKAQHSNYEILVDKKVVARGSIKRASQKLATPADYVDTQVGASHSRWMIAPGPWMPFSMVKISPDNQNHGWWSGYDPMYESVGTFSHIHEWTMAGLGMLPVNGPLKIKIGDQNELQGTGYRSRIDKSTEEAPLGYYKADLLDYHIKAELTATTRASFQRYTYPEATDSRIMIDLQIPSEYEYQLQEVSFRKVNDYRIEGFSKQQSLNTWRWYPSQQDYIVHFVIEFDRPIRKMGVWSNDAVSEDIMLYVKDVANAGAYVEFDTRKNQVVQVRTGLSFVSIAGASENLEAEISKPFGWSFDGVRDHQRKVWDDLFQRVHISSNDRREKMRFYSNMYRALCSRNTFSDIDGKWVDATEKVQQLKDPDAVALGCDAFWNTFWNLNQFWNLVTPEWSSRWVKSQLAMYDANGWLAKGPAGMEYIPVMVAEHEVPLITGAYQMGIRDYDVQKAFEAAYKTLNTPAEMIGGNLAGNADFEHYIKYKYVPYDKGRFSNTMEFAYDDWTLSQFAKSLGKTKEYQELTERSGWWKNVMDPETGYARLRKSDGSWFPDFDPFQSGGTRHYVEGNAWQLTFFVPQDIPGLLKAAGEKRLLERLEWGFQESYKWRFNAPNEAYWNYPVIQGNQQSMHFAFLFNWMKRPWLTQQWSRTIIDRYYGYGTTAYPGDEDQGQMSAWFIMASLGLFQTDGGCRIDPIYEIASPIFSNVSINLGERYGRGKSFDIEAVNVSRDNKYVQRAILNGKELESFWFPASELLKGGKLVLQMGAEPNINWGSANPPDAAK